MGGWCGLVRDVWVFVYSRVVSGFSTRISHTYGIGLDRIGILTSSWYVRTVRDVLWANYLAIDYESSSYYIYYDVVRV